LKNILKVLKRLFEKKKRLLGCGNQFYLHSIEYPDVTCRNGFLEEEPCPICQKEFYKNNPNIKLPKRNLN